MHITFTDEAIAAMQSRCGPAAKLKLVFDSEGCGCAVSGVPTFWLVSGPDRADARAETNAFEVYYEERHAVFFEDDLTVDVVPAGRDFRLKSKQQIYNGSTAVVDKTS